MPKRASKKPTEPRRTPTGQFVPGQSGNKKGRPKGAKNRSTMILGVMNELIPVEQQGRKKKMPVGEAAFRKLTQSALKGDMRAFSIMMREWAAAEARNESQEPIYAFSDRDREVIAEIHARMKACEEPAP